MLRICSARKCGVSWLEAGESAERMEKGKVVLVGLPGLTEGSSIQEGLQELEMEEMEEGILTYFEPRFVFCILK